MNTEQAGKIEESGCIRKLNGGDECKELCMGCFEIYKVQNKEWLKGIIGEDIRPFESVTTAGELPIGTSKTIEEKDQRIKELEEGLKEMEKAYANDNSASVYGILIKLLNSNNSSTERGGNGKLFDIVLTSVGVELLSFRTKTKKISDEEEQLLTETIVNRIMRKLKEYNITSNNF